MGGVKYDLGEGIRISNRFKIKERGVVEEEE